MLQAAIEQLGGDPTAVTPAANLSATASQGVPKVVADPRTTLLQSLEAVLIAELSDNACWETLVELAQQAGENDLGQQFEQVHATEQEHLDKVRTGLAAGQGLKEPRSSNGKARSKQT
jgi:hypothetical protein